MKLMEVLNEQKGLKFRMNRPLRRQDQDEERPCPLGAKFQECEMLELLIKATAEDELTSRLIIHDVLIPHLVTWHYEELKDMVAQRVLELLGMK